MSTATRNDFGRLAIMSELQKRGYDLAICLTISRAIPDDDAPDFGLFDDRLKKALIFAAKYHNNEINRLEAEADELQQKIFEIQERVEKLRKAVTEI